MLNFKAMFQKTPLFRWLSTVSLSTLATISTITPLQAAEKISFYYTPLGFTVRISSLERFADEGIVDKNLRFYLNLPGLSDEEIATFREALNKPIEIDPVLLYRVLNTEIGIEILELMGQVINIQGGGNGKYAIRAAFVQAAFEPGGWTLLNFFKKLPVNMQVDLQNVLQLAQQIELAVQATEYATEVMIDLAAKEAGNDSPIDYAQLPDIRQPGPFPVQQQRWQLTDNSRKRSFYVDVYQPQQKREGETPVVIISHGLSSSPDGFKTLAKHLASYGYVIAAPQHIGSDTQQTKNLIEGYSLKLFDIDEFINRPLDISYVIDELERRNDGEFAGKLALNQVGVFGHSFGGYTALALAGGTIDFDNLARQCDLQNRLPNTALLLQCRALNLPKEDYNFRDIRVQAVFVGNPVNRAIFGENGLNKIKIPVFVGAGNYDPATPFALEQLVSFPWLASEEKYLFMMEGQAHVNFAELDSGITEVVERVDALTLPPPQLLEDYNDTMTLSFFEVYLAENSEFKPYLKPGYPNYLGENEDFKAHLITRESVPVLNEMIQRFRHQSN